MLGSKAVPDCGLLGAELFRIHNRVIGGLNGLHDDKAGLLRHRDH